MAVTPAYTLLLKQVASEITERAKPAASDSNPINPKSGNGLAVLGKVFSGSGVCTAAVSYRRGLNDLSHCNHFSCRFDGLDRRLPSKLLPAVHPPILLAAVRFVASSVGIARTGRFVIFASSIALFFG